MPNKAKTIEQFIGGLPEERREVFNQLRLVIQENLPPGFSEVISYGMLAYVVPHSVYADGYHCDPKKPLPFISIASHKSAISFYHMGLYADDDLQTWFVNEYPRHSNTKLDMGKSCIRFKKIHHIPFDLIAELCSKMTVEKRIGIYEQKIKR